MASPHSTLALVLHVAAFPAARDALETEVLPRFAAAWEKEHDRALAIDVTYGSGVALTRAVSAGAEIDVVVLPAAPAWLALVEAGRADHVDPVVVATDVVAIGVRPGNPLGVERWDDLAHDGRAVVLAGPTTDTGGPILLAGFWGAALLEEPEFPPSAHATLDRLVANAVSRTGSVEEAVARFAAGEGDAVLADARTLTAARARGDALELVVPRTSFRFEQVAGVVARPDRHVGATAAAHDLVGWLDGPQAEAGFARAGFGRVGATGFTADQVGGWGALLAAVGPSPPAVTRELPTPTPLPTPAEVPSAELAAVAAVAVVVGAIAARLMRLPASGDAPRPSRRDQGPARVATPPPR